MYSWETIIETLQGLPYIAIGSFIATLLVFIIIRWKNVKEFLGDIKVWWICYKCNFQLTQDVTPAIHDSLALCSMNEPIMDVYSCDGIMSVEFRLEKSEPKIRIILDNGKAIALLPSKSMINVVKAFDMHLRMNLSQFSIVHDHPKLQRALEVYVMKMVMANSGLNGALKIAMERFLNKMKQGEDITLLLNVLANVNSTLKETKPFISRKFLRILLIECCRVEFNAVGKVFT
jgi:hypothetical protein